LPIDSFIKDGQGSGHHVRVDHTNSIKVREGEPSTASRTQLAANNVGYTLKAPIQGFKFLITGLIINAASTVTGNATIDIYESDTADSTVSTMDILTLDILKNDTIIILPVNILVEKGSFINAKTDDNVVNITILGYYEHIEEIFDK